MWKKGGTIVCHQWVTKTGLCVHVGKLSGVLGFYSLKDLLDCAPWVHWGVSAPHWQLCQVLTMAGLPCLVWGSWLVTLFEASTYSLCCLGLGPQVCLLWMPTNNGLMSAGISDTIKLHRITALWSAKERYLLLVLLFVDITIVSEYFVLRNWGAEFDSRFILFFYLFLFISFWLTWLILTWLSGSIFNSHFYKP